MIRWLFGYLKKQRALLAVSLLFAVLSGALLLVGPLFLGKAVDALTAEGGVKWDELGRNLAFLSIFYASGAILSYLSPLLSGKAAAGAVTSIRNDTFTHILHLPLRFFDTNPHGDVISRITVDCENIYDGLGTSFVQLFSSVVTVAGTLIAMFVISPAIAAAVLCITPLSLVIARFVVIRTARLFAAQQKKTGELGGQVEEILSGIRTVHENSMEDSAMKEFERVNSELYVVGRSAQFGGALVNPSTRLVNNISYICVGLMGAIFAVKGITAGGAAMSVGIIATMLSYATQFAKPINEIAGVTTQIQNAFASASRIIRIQEEVPESDDSRLPELPASKGGVTVEHLKFSYTPEKPLISDLSFEAVPGSVIMAGHSHLDIAWLWTVNELTRKCARTFSSNLALMDMYPDFRFTQSQAAVYWFIKEYYPELWPRIKEKVKNGQWEIVGNTWVEADTNLASGESLVRQLLYGREFFLKEFGVCSDIYWLPDCFGFTAALPQIIKRSGMKYFYT